MAIDVEIQKSELYEASTEIAQLLGTYRNSAGSAHRGDAGIGNPAGRTALRCALEDAIGDVAMRIQAQALDGSALSSRIVGIVTRFDELDASLGSGWKRDR